MQKNIDNVMNTLEVSRKAPHERDTLNRNPDKQTPTENKADHKAST